MITKGFIPFSGAKVFAIMEMLQKTRQLVIPRAEIHLNVTST